jgi:DNA-binding phage protein
MSKKKSAFWDDLVNDLQDPEFLREYVIQSVRISTIDALMNTLDIARDEAGMSKSDIARAVGKESAAIRRMFSTGHTNPTIGTLAEVAAALGLRISIEPMDAAERNAITEPLRTGRTQQPDQVIQQAERRRVPLSA